MLDFIGRNAQRETEGQVAWATPLVSHPTFFLLPGRSLDPMMGLGDSYSDQKKNGKCCLICSFLVSVTACKGQQQCTGRFVSLRVWTPLDARFALSFIAQPHPIRD